MVIIYGVLLTLNPQVLLYIRQSVISSMFIRGTFQTESCKNEPISIAMFVRLSARRPNSSRTAKRIFIKFDT
jgi:hypothetical protein